MIPIFLAVSILLLVNYQMTHQVIQDKYDQIYEMVEEGVVNAFVSINRTYEVGESQLNDQMKTYSDQLLDHYQANPNIASWDYQALKETFNGYEVYVIDQDLNVVASSFESDIGLDFKQYPLFAESLKTRFTSNTFFVSELEVSINTGKFQKFSYMPSPDQKYLFELSIDAGSAFDEADEINLFTEADKLKERYSEVTKIRLYKYTASTQETVRIIEDQPLEVVTSETVNALVSRAVATEENQYNQFEEGGHPYTCTYIPIVLGEESGFWNKMVVNVVYDRQPMMAEQNKARQMLFLNLSAIAILFAFFFISLRYLINRLESLAFKDTLTDLMNRVAFEERILKYYEKHANQSKDLVILFIDINKFKAINDTYGHQMGDDMIRKVAHILSDNFSSKGCVARMGGDEFVIAVTKGASMQGVIEKVEKVNAYFDQAIDMNGIEVKTSLSVGIAQQVGTEIDVEALIKRADMAMYQSKKEGKAYVIDKGDKDS